MPPFVNTKCTNCSKPNRFDLAELRKEGGIAFKDALTSQSGNSTEEFTVTCLHCGRKYKIIVKGEENGKA